MCKARFELRAFTSSFIRAAGALLLASCAGAYAAGPAKDQPPTVTLTSPASGASFFAPATISLAATASDPDGTVTRVDFFQGTTLIGSSTTAPYTATWSNVPVGTYSITAKATDNSGSTATSAAASITVNSATSLVITSPADGSAMSISCCLTVSGTFETTFSTGNTIVVDNGNHSELATINGTSYSASFFGSQGLYIGANTITARLDRPDKSSVTRSVTVFGYDTPVVAFIAPSTATFNSPATVTFGVDAKAPGGTVTKVDFFNGSTLVGTVTSPPYQVTLSNLAKGTYTIQANATSNQGPVGAASETITVLGPNVPPSISITSPMSGATFNAPASVPITVNATDSDGAVTLVEFFGDGALLGASSSAPFAFTWSNVAAGAHTITARATDNQGAKTTSAPVSITVNNPPAVTLTSPLQGASFLSASTITLTADASDTDGTVTKVEFYQGTTLIGTATTAPYSVTWAVTAPGTYALTVKAFDNSGAVTTSAPTTITVTGPQASMTSPASGASFTAPATVALAASVTDNDGGTITQVDFYQGTTLIGTATTAPYTFSWMNVAAGTYVLTAKATDSLGASGTSAGVAITVAGPQVSLTSPANGATFAAPATITLAASAAEVGSGATIAKVEFYQGTTLIGTATTAPYTVTWSNVAVGSYTLTAKATDSGGVSSTSAGVTITVAPALAITSPGDGASANGNSVLVSGTLSGPANTGVTVNGVIAITDANNNFYANNVPLQPGSNTLTATLTTPTGQTATRSVTVNSDGIAPPVQITASPLSGIAPLTTTFTIRNGGGTDATVRFNGTVVFTVTAGTEGAFTLTFNAPTTFPATVTATDTSGVVTSRSFVIVVKDGAVVDQMFKAIWSSVTANLAAGSIEPALTNFASGVRDRYRTVLTNIASSLPALFANPPVIHPTSLSGENDVEYFMVVPQNSINYGYHLYFSQGADGVWRLQSL